MTIEKAVAKAGWLVPEMSHIRTIGNVSVVTGYLTYDARKCNFSEVMYFVFLDNTYAGSLTPRTTDDFTMRVNSAERTANGIRVDFGFRSDRDPMCCQGHKVTASYEFKGGRLVLNGASQFSANN